MGTRFESRVLPLAVLLVLAVTWFLPGRSFAGQGMKEEPEVEVKAVEVKLSDLELLDQNGRTVRFRSDVIGDRIVLINTFFTSCGLICPILSAIFADVQDRLGDRLGEEVALVSISVDPRTDIPLRLKEYAGGWDAKPGWLFLTGEKPSVDRVLEGLGLYNADFTAHPAAFLVGDGRSGTWSRFYGFASPEQLLGKVNAFSADRRTTAR